MFRFLKMINFVLKWCAMRTTDIRKEIHEYIDRADERFLRLVHSMMKSEKKETGSDLFSTTDEDMIKRAEASLSSIAEGKTRDIKAFKKAVDSWKKQQLTR
ncbi:hypothetical protein LLG10_03290 [bacterium]|nr:hypothetical protein [bacterium]